METPAGKVRVGLSPDGHRLSISGATRQSLTLRQALCILSCAPAIIAEAVKASEGKQEEKASTRSWTDRATGEEKSKDETLYLSGGRIVGSKADHVKQFAPLLDHVTVTLCELADTLTTAVDEDEA